MKKILGQGVIRAWDRNRVFVEKAARRRLSPIDAVNRYGLDVGRANAYIEFDIEEELLEGKVNERTGNYEWFIIGDVILDNRDAEGIMNI